MPICPSCGRGVISPRITTSPFMIIKEQITLNELESKTVFVQDGKNQYGKEEHTNSYYLNREMGRVGLQLSSFSQSCLYLHHLPKAGRTKEGKDMVQGCMDYSLTELLRVAGEKKIVFVGGAGLVKTITGYNASDVYGLLCKSPLLPNVPTIIPFPNPDFLMRQPIGELRFSLKILKEQIDIYKSYNGIGV